FLNFGDSSLDFGLFFFSMNVTNIEDIKSDLRFKIDQFFRENGVEIPFPQRVIWQGKDSGEH
ncbi:MAG: small-conductance mechanosensitive channel, partial [Saprospiraceae bacterium]